MIILQNIKSNIYNIARTLFYKMSDRFNLYKRRKVLKNTVAHSLQSKYLDCFEMLQLIKENSQQDICIYDVGACIGTFTILAKGLFPNSIVHAFEPLPDHFQRLKSDTQGITNINLHQIGLGAENKVTRINVTNNSDSSSILKPSTQIKKYWDISTVEVREIKIYRLDDYVKNETHSIQMPDLIKLDVQGYELEVLEGAYRCLMQATWIIIEISFEELYEGQPLFHEIVNFMAKNDYYLYSLGKNTSTGLHPLVQADCLFKRNKLV
ncbi:FkbM family methyltransferase [Chamaesiphon sp. OTE_20_metabat_361]|uniref:FkbM family methyltransferase n=1 Tax=Chamaesiphon sp. OTE_20_metabat_361 TaxID=2964689 RepID=UPI00286D5321|nr:FkbM family methyltransferase [Chamaesiphon sp. OTE_20_metabat_361]